MSVGRRLALLEWSSRAGAWVLEDDYDGEFRYSGRPLPSLQGLDSSAGGRVLYLGTFSKSLFPALRLGYLVVPEALVGAQLPRVVFGRRVPRVRRAQASGVSRTLPRNSPAAPFSWTRAISESGKRSLTSTLSSPESTRPTMVAS